MYYFNRQTREVSQVSPNEAIVISSSESSDEGSSDESDDSDESDHSDHKEKEEKEKVLAISSCKGVASPVSGDGSSRRRSPSKTQSPASMSSRACSPRKSSPQGKQPYGAAANDKYRRSPRLEKHKMEVVDISADSPY